MSVLCVMFSVFILFPWNSCVRCFCRCVNFVIMLGRLFLYLLLLMF